MSPAAKAKPRDLMAAFSSACTFGLVAFASLREAALASDWATAPLERLVQFANGLFALILIGFFITRAARAFARPARHRRRRDRRSRADGYRLSATRSAGTPRHARVELHHPRPDAGVVGDRPVAQALLQFLPQARRLATYDPYRFLRHPLYVPEFLALFGLARQFAVTWLLSLWAWLRRRSFDACNTRAHPRGTLS